MKTTTLRIALLFGVCTALFTTAFTTACSGDPENEAGAGTPSATTEQAARASYVLRDATQESGLGAFLQVNGDPTKPFILEQIGGAVGMLDHDGDGDLDIYLSNGSSLAGFAPGKEPRDALYANDGKAHFTDVSSETGMGDTGWTMGVRVVDLDGDGWPDVYLTNYGPNVLYRNRGDGTFADETARAALGDPSWSTGACFLDHDADGDLDLYVANYVDFDPEVMLAERPKQQYQGISVAKGPRGLPAAPDHFYVNDGSGVFRDASVETGIDPEKAAFGFQCVVFDVDLDGWLDVFVANDSVGNYMWVNDGKGHFEDRALVKGLSLNVFGKAQAGMGVALGDYDGDLQVDLYVTNFSHDYATLYRGLKDAFFTDVTHRMRLVAATELDVGWGCHFLDLDSDGDLELIAVNGHVYPQIDEVDVGSSYAQHIDLFELERGRYRIPPGGGGPGLAKPHVSRGLAVGDLDGDGDLDVLVGNIDSSPLLLLNEGTSGNWLKVRLVGPKGNRDAIGARVVGRVGENAQLRLVGTSEGFLSSSDSRLHFGLGTATTLDSLEVTWSDGTLETFEDLPAGHVVTLEVGSSPRIEQL